MYLSQDMTSFWTARFLSLLELFNGYLFKNFFFLGHVEEKAKVLKGIYFVGIFL